MKDIYLSTEGFKRTTISCKKLEASYSIKKDVTITNTNFASEQQTNANPIIKAFKEESSLFLKSVRETRAVQNEIDCELIKINGGDAEFDICKVTNKIHRYRERNVMENTID